MSVGLPLAIAQTRMVGAKGDPNNPNDIVLYQGPTPVSGYVVVYQDGVPLPQVRKAVTIVGTGTDAKLGVKADLLRGEILGVAGVTKVEATNSDDKFPMYITCVLFYDSSTT
jgi:hypothetical protein